jgi:molecular chaperone GrpE
MNADEVETILADFRAWLLQAKDVPPAPSADTLDVAAIVQQFTALRHEVNLQTKASRAHLEQNSQTLAALQQSLDSDSQQPTNDELLRPLLKTLIDAHDALSLAEREVRRLLDHAPTDHPSAPARIDPPPAIKLKLPTWTRWFGLDVSIDAQLAPLRAWADAHQRTSPAPPLDESAQRFRQSLDALLVGYAMSMQRIERALEQQGLEAIPCVGQPFDPETMEVAEVVREEGRASTEVLQEIRRGYRWRGKLFRFAQVRVAKP